MDYCEAEEENEEFDAKLESAHFGLQITQEIIISEESTRSEVFTASDLFSETVVSLRQRRFSHSWQVSGRMDFSGLQE